MSRLMSEHAQRQAMGATTDLTRARTSAMEGMPEWQQALLGIERERLGQAGELGRGELALRKELGTGKLGLKREQLGLQEKLGMGGLAFTGRGQEADIAWREGGPAREEARFGREHPEAGFRGKLYDFLGSEMDRQMGTVEGGAAPERPQVDVGGMLNRLIAAETGSPAPGSMEAMRGEWMGGLSPEEKGRMFAAEMGMPTGAEAQRQKLGEVYDPMVQSVAEQGLTRTGKLLEEMNTWIGNWIGDLMSPDIDVQKEYGGRIYEIVGSEAGRLRQQGLTQPQVEAAIRNLVQTQMKDFSRWFASAGQESQAVETIMQNAMSAVRNAFRGQ
jgi:hypothetical protein